MDLSTLDRARLALMLRRDPSELPEHDGRTTIDGEQVEISPETNHHQGPCSDPDLSGDLALLVRR